MGAGDGERAPLLLHSLATLREILLPALDVADARLVVEVGGEDGGFTVHLVERARRAGGRVVVVDPSPSPELQELERTWPELELARGYSPAALEEIGRADAYFLDGDHNYATVTGELQAIDALGGSDGFPLVVLHDVGWPWGRRDLYYEPGRLPDDAVHPHTFDGGVRPGVAGIDDGGFTSVGEYAMARHEGGPANGVLTAVEDFCADHPALELVVIPAVFGFGVLFDRGAPYADVLRERLAPFDRNPLLARLEENRIALYLRVHDVLRDLEVVVAERDEARAALDDLHSILRELAGSRTVRSVDLVGKLSRRPSLGQVLEDLGGQASGEPGALG